jgi:hypothetical protein
MRHPSTQALYAYWNEVRGQRIAPRRLEVQPARIGELLLDSFILEVGDGGSYRFRLAGTRVSARFGASLKAADFLGCWKESDRGLVAYHLKAATDLGRVTLYTGEAEYAPATEIGRDVRTQGPFELIVLPLMHTGQAIDRLLCHLVPLEEKAPAKDARIAGLKLMAAETIWPDGEPKEADLYGDGQLAMHPRVRTARIVRHGRRQFRVYQGGLVAAGEDKR